MCSANAAAMMQGDAEDGAKACRVHVRGLPQLPKAFQRRTSVRRRDSGCAGIALHGVKVQRGGPRGRRLEELTVLLGGQPADHRAALTGKHLPQWLHGLGQCACAACKL